MISEEKNMKNVAETRGGEILFDVKMTPKKFIPALINRAAHLVSLMYTEVCEVGQRVS